MVNKLLMTSGIVVALCYLIHLGGPLRVVDDGPLYLVRAVDIASGSSQRESRMPRGYPQALATLEVIGLNCSAGIVGLNLVCLALGLVLITSVIRSEMGLSGRFCAICALLCCLSWVWIYLAPVPMSDMVFFGLASACLAALSESKHRPARAVPALIVAAVLSMAAFFVRTIGAALFAAVALCVLNVVARRFGRKTMLGVLLAGTTTVGAVGLVYWNSLFTPGYLQSWRETYVGFGRANIPYWRVAEIGELFQNVSARTFVPKKILLPIESVSSNELATRELEAVRYVSGAIAIALVLFGAWRRKAFSYIELFVASYLAILMVWPFTDVRFWSPVLPLLFAYAWIGLRSLVPGHVARKAAVGYCVVFCLFGAVALTNSVYASTFARARTCRRCYDWVSPRPDWLAAYERFGGTSDAGTK